MNTIHMNDKDWNQYLDQVPKEWALNLKEAVENGAVDPLLAYTKLHELEDAIKQAKEVVYESAINEADKYTEKTFTFHGYEVQKKSAAGRWDFKHIPAWNIVKEQLAEVEEKCKTAFKMAEKGDTYVGEGGEEVTPAMYTPGKSIISLRKLK